MTDLTTLGTWSIVNLPPGVTATINAGTGQLSVTAMTVTEAYVPCQFLYGGIARVVYQHIIKQCDPPTNSGSSSGGTSGSSANTTSLAPTSGTGYSSSAVLKVTAGANGRVDLSAPISYRRTPGTNGGTTGAAGKWQWRVVGGTFADVAAETVDTADAAQTEAFSGEPTVNYAGSLSVTAAKTGLTAGTAYEFQFLWRRVDVSGPANDIYNFGSTPLSATGS